MKNAFLFLLVSTLLVACGQPGHEDLVKDTVSIMDKAARALDGVEDEGDAKAALGAIESCIEDLEELRLTAEVLGDPTEEMSKQLMEEYGPRLVESGQRFGEALQKALADPAVATVLGPALQRLQAKLNSF